MMTVVVLAGLFRPQAREEGGAVHLGVPGANRPLRRSQACSWFTLSLVTYPAEREGNWRAGQFMPS